VLQFDDAPLNINVDRLRDRIDGSIDAQVITMHEQTSNVRTLFRRSFIGMAASLAILAAAVMFLSNDMNTITAPHGNAMVHTLPDQSKIDINAGSSIEYDTKNWDSNREVSLDGEAFFDVEKGSKFTVVTANGNVEVLGTEFNVYSRGHSFQVKCTEGKVRVTAKGKEEILLAGDVVELSNTELQKIPFQAKYDWRQKAYNYKNATLGEVFGEIERQFDMKVSADPSILNAAFTGPLETKELEKAMYMVTWPMNLEYVIKGNTIVIKKK